MTDVCSNRRSVTQDTLTAWHHPIVRRMLVPAKSLRRPLQTNGRRFPRTYELSLFTVHLRPSMHIASADLRGNRESPFYFCAGLTQGAGISRNGQKFVSC